jgi:hypothetical protein
VQTYIADAFSKITATPEYLRTYAVMSKAFDVDSFAKYGDYTINSSLIKNPLFKKVKMTVVHCMGKYGRARVDKITKDEMSEGRKEIEIDRLSDLFFVTKQENKMIQNKRAREYFKKRTHLIILEVLDTVAPTMDAKGKPVLDKENKQMFHPVSYPAEFKQLVAELGAKDFSSITYVDPPKVKKEKVKREDTEICLHMTGGSRHKYTTCATNTQKWIYVPLKEGSWPDKFDRRSMTSLEDFTESLESTKICGLADRAVKMVQGDANFVSITDWLAAFKPSKDCLLAAKKTLSKCDSDCSNLLNLKDIEDPFLIEMIDEYKAFAKAKLNVLPEFILTRLLEVKEIKEFKEADEKFGKLMKSEYPIVAAVGHYSQYRKDLTFYINAKYNERKGK